MAAFLFLEKDRKFNWREVSLKARFGPYLSDKAAHVTLVIHGWSYSLVWLLYAHPSFDSNHKWLVRFQHHVDNTAASWFTFEPHVLPTQLHNMLIYFHGPLCASCLTILLIVGILTHAFSILDCSHKGPVVKVGDVQSRFELKVSLFCKLLSLCRQQRHTHCVSGMGTICGKQAIDSWLWIWSWSSVQALCIDNCILPDHLNFNFISCMLYHLHVSHQPWWRSKNLQATHT